MINSHSDLLNAYDSGRHHCQRVLKNAGSTGDTHWLDWSFASGQPAYDARIGPALALLPIVATGNDAIYFPSIPATQTRHLHRVTMRPQANNASQASIDFALYDLVAVYPLIDGDSIDPQEMDNTLALPRYSDGAGLRLVMVNHVAPGVQNGRMLLEYTDGGGVDRTADLGVPNLGVNKCVSGVQASLSTTPGPLFLSLEGNGVQRVNRITYTVPPGGLHCIYVVKPLAQFTHWHDALLQADVTGVKAAIEVDFALKDGWRLPIIKDGAHLGFFYRPNGGGRTVTMFGDLEFIWG